MMTLVQLVRRRRRCEDCKRVLREGVGSLETNERLRDNLSKHHDLGSRKERDREAVNNLACENSRPSSRSSVKSEPRTKLGQQSYGNVAAEIAQPLV